MTALFFICIDSLLRNINSDINIDKVLVTTKISRTEVDFKAGSFADDIGVICKNDPIIRSWGSVIIKCFAIQNLSTMVVQFSDHCWVNVQVFRPPFDILLCETTMCGLFGYLDAWYFGISHLKREPFSINITWAIPNPSYLIKGSQGKPQSDLYITQLH